MRLLNNACRALHLELSHIRALPKPYQSTTKTISEHRLNLRSQTCGLKPAVSLLTKPASVAGRVRQMVSSAASSEPPSIPDARFSQLLCHAMLYFIHL